MGTTVMFAAVGSSSEMACLVRGAWASSDDLVASGKALLLRASLDDLVATAIYPTHNPFPKEGGLKVPGVFSKELCGKRNIYRGMDDFTLTLALSRWER